MTTGTINPTLLAVYSDRVARTIALFDAADPNWRDDIDLDRLDMSDFTACISGQIRGRWAMEAMEAPTNPVIADVIWHNAEPGESETYPTSLGLEVEDAGDPEQYATLQVAWMEALSATA